MARAPQTGFYFEPMSERLALVIEGTPYPSDDHWAFIGDPVEISPEVARLECANRWPGVDPDSLEVELTTDFDRLLEEIERAPHEPADPMLDGKRGEIDFDVSFLLQQAEALKEMAAQLRAPGARELEEAMEAGEPETVGAAIVRANKG
jgi:hypothetical protein